MKLNAVTDKIVLKKVELQETTASGIILPNTTKDNNNIGEVVSVGQEGEKLFKEGDKVIYSKFSETEVEIQGEKFLILKQSDILAIIK